MADRSFGFLSGYSVKLYALDTEGGPSIERDDKGFPLVNQANIGTYRDAGVDQIVKAMRDLTQKKMIDLPPGNKLVAQLPSIKPYHKSIETPVARGIAQTLIQNSRGATSSQSAISKIWNAVVPNGLMLHFPPPTSMFNAIPGGKPPPGFATLLKTQIVAPPSPVKPPIKNKYDGFSAQGVRYDDEGGASETSAPSSVIGQFFDYYIQAVETQTQLLHQGLATGTQTPITANAKVQVTI